MALDNSKMVSDVVDRLKKQGLFDKFRKECMADVDTKVHTRNSRNDSIASCYLSVRLSVRPSVCLSVTCIVTLRVGVRG